MKGSETQKNANRKDNCSMCHKLMRQDNIKGHQKTCKGPAATPTQKATT